MKIGRCMSFFGAVMFLGSVAAVSFAQDPGLQADGSKQDGEPFKFLFAGYSTKWKAGESAIIETQKDLDRAVHELISPEFVGHLPDLLPEIGRPDFNPVVDFDQYVVVVVMGQPHETPCRRTKVLGFTRSPGNHLQISVEESDTAECKIGAPTFENQITLVQIKRPVFGFSIVSGEKR